MVLPRSPAPLALLLLLASPPELPAQAPPSAEAPPARERSDVTLERWSWSREVDGEPAIRLLDVRNDYGDVRARFAGDRQAEAWAVIQRLDRGPAGVGVTVERRGDVVALTVAYPPGRIQDADPDPPKDSHDRLDLTVFVPEGVAFSAKTLRGVVEARGLKSDVAAETLEGAVSVGTTGGVRARTASGEVSVAFGARAGFQILESGSGSIRVALPAEARLELRAETGGTLTTEASLTRRTEGGRTTATGPLGGGGPMLLIRSGTGDVELR